MNQERLDKLAETVAAELEVALADLRAIEAERAALRMRVARVSAAFERAQTLIDEVSTGGEQWVN